MIVFLISGYVGSLIGGVIYDPDKTFLTAFIPFLGGIFGSLFLFNWAQYGISKLLEASGVLHGNMARIESDVRFASEV